MGGAWYETAFGAHYPLLYAHRDEAEARACLSLLPRLAPLKSSTGRPILDLGCGDGRHLAPLAGTGSTVVGLDLSVHLLAVARDRTAAPLVRGDMAGLPFLTGAFDSVLSLFTAFGYFGDLTANAPVVNTVARVLAAGGHWFLDYFDCDRVRSELADAGPAVRQRNIGPLSVTETRVLRADGRQVCKAVHLVPRPGQESAAARIGIPGDGLIYEEKVAVFDLTEMDHLAADHGLHRVALAGGYGGQAAGEGTRWLMVYRKDEAR